MRKQSIKSNGKGLSILLRKDLDSLFESLRKQGFIVLGPTPKEGSIVYDVLESSEDLPVGWVDEQEGGRYRLQKTPTPTLFDYTVGPQAWKKFLFPPRLKLWQVGRNCKDFQLQENNREPEKYALVGVRACEIQAMGIQDQIFLKGSYADPYYQERRNRLFILAVNCGRAGGTCFCSSMKSGPKAESGFDLSLTEILESSRHYFVVSVGSDQGREILQTVPHSEAGDQEVEAAEQASKSAADHMGRSMDTTDIQELLNRNLEHPLWDEVASRCLSCSNCTLVCPTCFCTTFVDNTDLGGTHAQRTRLWDSCFTLEYSYIHGGSVRSSPKSRYRQWLTHKLGTWIDQFGLSGCVGCGRCITWCPVAIDLTEEVRALRAGETLRR